VPRVIIGSPLFNHAKDFPEAIDSILNQTYTDFALVLVDDCSTDETPAIAQEYAALDSRVSYQRNTERLGLIANSHEAFNAARQRHPEAEYFAWASDHDLWHPRWLQQLVEAMDANPDVVLSYPLNRRIGAAGEVLKRRPWAFDTFGVTDRWVRMRRSIKDMSAGNMVYGLYRVSALERAGVYRHVLVPDRLLFTELALYGQFKQVPQVLWFRRWYGRIFSLGRQRVSFFPNGRPLYAYFPWWISHACSLFWTFTVRGHGRPQVSRLAGVWAALQCFVLAGLLHLWQTLRAIRNRILESIVALRPGERRVRLLFRSIGRRGLVDWTRAHLREYMGAKALRKARARAGKSMRYYSFEAVRRPGLWLLNGLRALPVVKTRVIPALLKEQLDEMPASPHVEAMRNELEPLRKTTAPIVVGPWVGEVGYELLYWIPFLNWALKEFGLDQRRLIVVSRGGARHWYRHITNEYVDVFDLFSLDEYREANELRWDKAGHQKQYRVEQMDRDIADRVKARLGLDHVEMLHPGPMYRLLRFFWFEKAGISILKQHTEYKPLERVERSAALKDLPRDYVAVRFYFRPSFPDTPENRQFAADIVRTISRDVPVVLLNTGLKFDDHDDLNVPGMGIYHVDRLMTAERNLEVQTEIVCNARAFVGTYGGLAYLATFYGVPSFAFYSTQAELLPAHMDMWWRLSRLMGVSASALDTRATDLLRTVIGQVRQKTDAPVLHMERAVGS
jgi:glycosyltransferase involved in cell wall biosynthesis